MICRHGPHCDHTGLRCMDRVLKPAPSRGRWRIQTETASVLEGPPRQNARCVAAFADAAPIPCFLVVAAGWYRWSCEIAGNCSSRSRICERSFSERESSRRGRCSRFECNIDAHKQDRCRDGLRLPLAGGQREVRSLMIDAYCADAVALPRRVTGGSVSLPATRSRCSRRGHAREVRRVRRMRSVG